MLVELTSLSISGSGLTCPADGSKCVVQQSNATSFCRLCFSFCSSCTPHTYSSASTHSSTGILLSGTTWSRPDCHQSCCCCHQSPCCCCCCCCYLTLG
ncbi:hypothetical protein CLOM_g18369 [Closterium sp. NIES-68]|nr:hypothetical protein CLOM_g18369 [Closterium sp. NIES-68]GJP80834.1 hypothetical protein CLOP_g11030 [Closterium sp. NIES-67]